jgi:hypothetical protein
MFLFNLSTKQVSIMSNSTITNLAAQLEQHIQEKIEQISEIGKVVKQHYADASAATLLAEDELRTMADLFDELRPIEYMVRNQNKDPQLNELFDHLIRIKCGTPQIQQDPTSSEPLKGQRKRYTVGGIRRMYSQKRNVLKIQSDGETLITTKECAQLAGVAATTILNWRKNGLIEPISGRSVRPVLYKKSSIEKIVSGLKKNYYYM